MQTFDDLIELFQVAKPAIARGARASLLRLLHLTTPSITEATRIMDYVVRTADAEIAEACLRRKMFNKNAFLHKILDNPDKQDRSRLFDLAAEASFMSEENDQVHITNDRVANKPIPLGPVAIAALPGRKTSTSCRRSGKAPDSAVKEALHPDGFGMITESFSREGDVLDFGSASSRPRNGNPSAPAFTSRSHSTLPDRYAPSTPSDAFATPRSPWSLSSVKSDSGSIPSSHRSTPPSTPSNRRQRNADNGPLATALPHCQRFNSWQNRRKERADGGALDPIPSSRLEPVAEEKKENEDIYWESTRAESCTGRSREAGVVESATIRMGDDCDTLVDAARNDRRKQGIETAKHECMEWAGNTNEWNQKLPRNPGEVQNSSRESGEVMNEEKKYVEVEMRNGPAGETTRLVALDFTHLSGRNMADSICVSTQDMPDLIRDSANVAQDTPTRLTLETPDSVRCTTRVRENTWYAKQIVESQPANTPLRQYTLDSSRELIHQVTLSTPNAAYALSQQITRGVPNMTRELADQMTRDMPNSMRGPAQPMAHDVTDAPQLLPHALRQDASSSTHGDPGHPISRDSRNPIDPPSIILEVHQPMRGAPAPDMPQPNTPTPYTPSDSLLSTSRDHNLSSPASCPPPTYDGISSTTPPWPDENLFTSPSADHTQAASGTPGRSCGEISATTPPLPDDDNALVSSIGIEPPLNPTHSLANAQLSPKTSPSRHNYDTHEPLTSIDGALKSADSKPPVNSLSVGGALQPVSESVTERSDTPPWRCQRTPLSPHSSTGKTTPRFAQEEEAAPTIMIPRPLHPRTLTFDDLDHVSQPHSARGDTLPRVAKLTVPRRTLSFSDENNGVSCSPSSDYERLCAYATAASTTCSPNAPLPCESRILSRHHRSASPAEGDAHEASNNRAPWISDAPLSVEMLTEALMKLPPQRAWQELFDRIGEAWADDDQLTLLSAVGNRLCDALTSRSGILVLDVSRIPFQAWIKLSFVPLLVPHVSPQSVGIEALNIISLSSLAAPQSKAANGLMRLHERCRDLISHSITIPERTRHLDAMRAIVDGESVALAEYVNHLVDQYGQVPSYGDAKAFAEHNMLPFVFPDFLLDELKKQLCRNELTSVKATLQLINALLTRVPAAKMLVVRRCRETVARLLKNRGALKASAEDVLTKMGWCPVWSTPDSTRDSEISEEIPVLIALNTSHAAHRTKCDREDAHFFEQSIGRQPANAPIQDSSISSSGLTRHVARNAPNVANCPTPLKTRGLANATREPARQITLDPMKSTRDPWQLPTLDMPSSRHGSAPNSTNVDPVRPTTHDSTTPIDHQSTVLEVHQLMCGSAPACSNVPSFIRVHDTPTPRTPEPKTPPPNTPSGSRLYHISTSSSPPPTYDGISSTTPPFPDEHPFMSPSSNFQAVSGTPGSSCGEISSTTPPLPNNDTGRVSSIVIDPPESSTHSLPYAKLFPNTPPSRDNCDTRASLASVDAIQKSSRAPISSRSAPSARHPRSARSAASAWRHASEPLTERSDTPPWRRWRAPSSHPSSSTPHFAHKEEEDSGICKSPSSDYDRLLAFAKSRCCATTSSPPLHIPVVHPAAASTACSPNAPLHSESRFLSRHHRSASPAEGDAHEPNNIHTSWISDAPLSVEMLTEALMELPSQRAWQELFRISDSWQDNDELTFLSAVGHRLCDTLTCRSGILVLNVSRIPLHVWAKLAFAPLLAPYVSPQSAGIEALVGWNAINARDASRKNATDHPPPAPPRSKAAKGLIRLHESCKGLISRSMTVPERTQHLDVMRTIVVSESMALAEYAARLVHQYGQVPSYGDAKAFAEHNMLPFVFPDFLLDELKKQLCRNELTCVKATLQLINALLTHVPAATMIVVRRCGEAVARLLKNRGALKALAEDVLTRMGWRIVWNECRQQASRGKKKQKWAATTRHQYQH
eukprot:GEMP01000201.1.p1 GENE.GEMP01000201.1~~GEMP01000201.1.p1  ORF type:complete len:1932 (+),score=376.17 GEMP01000201.1:181-5976(+)